MEEHHKITNSYLWLHAPLVGLNTVYTHLNYYGKNVLAVSILHIHVPLLSGPPCHVLVRADGLRVLRANTGRRMATGGSVVMGLGEQLTLNGGGGRRRRGRRRRRRRRRRGGGGGGRRSMLQNITQDFRLDRIMVTW